MNITITTFTNPFSFFCKVESDTGGGSEVNLANSNFADTSPIYKRSFRVSDFEHGQYVAVTWKDKLVRGIVSMESNFLIWLVDYGFYLHPDDRTVIINLPPEYKKYPTKVFEASIHGVCPVDKVLTFDGQMKNEVTTTWYKGAIQHAESLIASAKATYFMPVALLKTRENYIVLGDLYLQLRGKGFVNIVNELELYPVYLEKNAHIYVKCLPTYYTSRRKHRASFLPPEFPNFKYILPTLNVATSLQEYSNVCANTPPFEPTCEYDSHSEDDSTVVVRDRKKSAEDFLTCEEILKYSTMFVTIHDRTFTVLSILMSKLRDLRMCEKYKDHDLKGIGRASFRSRPAIN